MGDTKIEWTDKTWSPLRARVKNNAREIAQFKGYTSLVNIAEKMAGRVGPHCEHVSEGCSNCYAESNNHRCLPSNGSGLPYDRRSRDLVEPFVDEKILAQPLRWKDPVKVFVENQSDLFGDWVPDEMIDRVFAVIALCPQHTFQVLTKRAERLLAWSTSFASGTASGRVRDILYRWPRFNPHIRLPKTVDIDGAQYVRWPLPNVWLGVSVEDQKTANARIPLLLQTPAAKRFISYEPALGPVDLTTLPSVSGIGRYLNSLNDACIRGSDILGRLDWVICGGESGPGARPMHPDWARSVRDQCREAEVTFFFKQWGEFASVSEVAGPGCHHHFPDGATVRRVGKKAAGALLDGQEYKEFPVGAMK